VGSLLAGWREVYGLQDAGLAVIGLWGPPAQLADRGLGERHSKEKLDATVGRHATLVTGTANSKCGRIFGGCLAMRRPCTGNQDREQ
jgi:hypothetical protein